MKRATMPLSLLEAVKKRPNFGNSTPNEPVLKERLRKPCAPVKCGERATSGAKSFGFRHFLRLLLLMSFVLSSGLQATDLLHHRCIFFPSASLPPNFSPGPNKRQFSTTL